MTSWFYGGGGFCDEIAKASELKIVKMRKGIKNCPKLRDVIYGRPTLKAFLMRASHPDHIVWWTFRFFQVTILSTFNEQFFLYEIVFRDFFVFSDWICHFCQKVIGSKAVRKMLVKFAGVTFSNKLLLIFLVQKCFVQLFSAYSLGLYLLVKGNWHKSCS